MTFSMLQSGDLLPAEFLSLLDSLTPPSGEPLRVWIEAPDGWALDYWKGLNQEILWCGAGRRPERQVAREVIERASTGRLFAPSGELRWRVLPALGTRCCRVVFLGRQHWVADSPLQPSLELARLQSRTSTVLLWGQLERSSQNEFPEWVTLRIPHRFRYPVDPLPTQGPQGVRARVETWSDARGEPHFVRFCDLEPFESKE